jgi:glycine/D-amino acid oxidase-like deaminating enzyme
MKLPCPVEADDMRNLSWWQRDLCIADESARARPLVGTVNADFVIIGGGFTGLWTALTIKERMPSASVAILEAFRCGSGASSRSGGSVHGYWTALPALSELFGPDKAIEAARLGTKAQDRLRRFACSAGKDIWWSESGYLRVATNARQQVKASLYVEIARRLGVPDTVIKLSKSDLDRYCSSPFFKSGLIFPEGATVHPARLAESLRHDAGKAGVSIFESTRVIGIDTGDVQRVRTVAGEVMGRTVILATYTGTMAIPAVRASNTLFSSFPVMSHPDECALARMNYREARGIADLRMFAHYFRRTRDGRVLMGTGSGPVGYGTRHNSPMLRQEQASIDRARRALQRFFPTLPPGIAAAWGFPIEVSADRLPYFGRIPGTRIFYGSGYSGHGINATCIAGECLASLALGVKDEWSNSVFCNRKQVKFPPEPFRYFGGKGIRSGIVTCEDAEDAGRTAPFLARLLATAPGIFNLKIGTR